ALAAGKRWDLVFNIAEGTHGRSREAQVPAILECLSIPYTMCDPLTASITLDKETAKRIVRDHGLATPDFTVIKRPGDINTVTLPFPLFLKPVAEGTGKGISSRSLVRDHDELESAALEMLKTYAQPVLVEAYLPGREVTVGVIGTDDEAEAIGVMEIIFKPGIKDAFYSHHVKDNYKKFVEYRLLEPGDDARKAEELAVSAHTALGCRDVSRVDLRADGHGKWHFLEVNPLPGLHPVDSDLPILCRLKGIEYHKLIENIISSALKRIHSPYAGSNNI
ncbi:MAG: D-alanine--D-alanine ligase family protein, partial [Dissulfurimicrobium sp.]